MSHQFTSIYEHTSSVHAKPMHVYLFSLYRSNNTVKISVIQIYLLLLGVHNGNIFLAIFALEMYGSLSSNISPISSLGTILLSTISSDSPKKPPPRGGTCPVPQPPICSTKQFLHPSQQSQSLNASAHLFHQYLPILFIFMLFLSQGDTLIHFVDKFVF